MLPTAERIGPGFDGVFVNGLVVKGTNTAPAIVINKHHWRLPPSALPDAPFQNRRNHVVTVFENVRLNNEVFAHDSLDRIAAAIDQRLHVLDRNR